MSHTGIIIKMLYFYIFKLTRLSKHILYFATATFSKTTTKREAKTLYEKLSSRKQRYSKLEYIIGVC